MRSTAACALLLGLMMLKGAEGVFTKDRKGNPVNSRGAAAQARMRQQQAARVAANARANAAKAKAAKTANAAKSGPPLPGVANTAWTQRLSGKITAAPLVLDSNNAIYSTEDQKLVCVNTNNGAVVWSFSTAGVVVGTPVADKTNSRIYFGTTTGNVYGIHRDGRADWQVSAGTRISAPATTAEDKVFACTNDGFVKALDIVTGKEMWSHKRSQRISTPVTFVSRDTMVNPPEKAVSVVLFGCDDRSIYAVDAASGNMRWSFAGKSSMTGIPSVYEDRVYIGSNDFFMYSLDLHTGSKKWHLATRGAIKGGAVVRDGILYFGGLDNSVYAVYAGSGVIKWKHTGNSPVAGSVVFDDNVKAGTLVAAFANGEVRGLDVQDQGSRVWEWSQTTRQSINQGGATIAKSITSTNQFFVGFIDGNAHAVKVIVKDEEPPPPPLPPNPPPPTPPAMGKAQAAPPIPPPLPKVPPPQYKAPVPPVLSADQLAQQREKAAAKARQLQEATNINTDTTDDLDDESSAGGSGMTLYLVLFGVVAMGGGGAFAMQRAKKKRGGLPGAHWD